MEAKEITRHKEFSLPLFIFYAVAAPRNRGSFFQPPPLEEGDHLRWWKEFVSDFVTFKKLNSSFSVIPSGKSMISGYR